MKVNGVTDLDAVLVKTMPLMFGKHWGSISSKSLNPNLTIHRVGVKILTNCSSVIKTTEYQGWEVLDSYSSKRHLNISLKRCKDTNFSLTNYTK